MNDQEPAVIIKDLYKSFKLPHERHSGLKQAILSFFKRGETRGYENQHVLKNVSFEIQKGEFFGIVGRNGSGKSTLLKLLAGIYTPDNGAIAINGTLVPFIELGVGFNPELTGRENVYLNGSLLGFSRKEMDGMYDEIVKFAELERFMDQKLKNYSSGMQVRLAFSVAIQAKSDILVLDEVLAVGDEAFQRKCQLFFEEVKNEKRTVILVTHDMSNVERYCSKALLLEGGVIKAIGNPSKIAKQYTLDNMSSEQGRKNLGDDVELLDIELLSEKSIGKNDNLEFNVNYRVKGDVEVDLGISIIRNGQSIIEHNTKDVDLDQAAGKKHTLNYKYNVNNLTPGRYSLSVAIFEKQEFTLIGYNSVVHDFIIEGPEMGGIVRELGTWHVVS